MAATLFKWSMFNRNECTYCCKTVHGKVPKILVETSSDFATDKSVAVVLNKIGQCLVKMNELAASKVFGKSSRHSIANAWGRSYYKNNYF